MKLHAAVAVVLAVFLFPGHARAAVHRLPHAKPFSRMSDREVERYLRRQVWHDRTAIRWIATHHGSGRVLLVADAQTEVRWFQVSLRIASRNLEQVRARIDAPQARSVSLGAWLCIHQGEGAWDANTGNGYYGGLQMDLGFQRTYGSEYLARWGTADRWPPWAQIAAAQRAHDGYAGYGARGYGPWPNTARACGLL